MDDRHLGHEVQNPAYRSTRPSLPCSGHSSEPFGVARVASAARPHFAIVRYAALVPVIDLDAAPADAAGRRTLPRPALGALALVLVLAAVTGEPVARTPVARSPLPVNQPIRCQVVASTGDSSAPVPSPAAVVILDGHTGQEIVGEVHCTGG